jgi:hypothetical protein
MHDKMYLKLTIRRLIIEKLLFAGLTLVWLVFWAIIGAVILSAIPSTSSYVPFWDTMFIIILAGVWTYIEEGIMDRIYASLS